MTQHPHATPAWDALQAPDPRRWFILAAVNFGLFMALLDVTVVNVALPNIARSFGTSFADLQWVIATYTLTYAALILTASKLGDLFGRKRLFLAGLVLFTLASLACGLAHDVTQLQLARAAQGIGAAMLTPIAGAIIAATFRGRELGTAFGIYGGVSGIALACGPIIGGLLVKYANWQSVFFLNVPIGIIGIVVVSLVVRESYAAQRGQRIDIPGALLSVATLFALTLALIRGAEWGWSDPRTLGVFAAAAVGFALFIGVEAATLRAGRDPMIDLSLFRVASFNVTAFVTLVVSLIYAGLLFVLALLFQNVLGYDALGTGIRYIPFVIASIVVGPLVGSFSDRIDPRIRFGGSLFIFGLGLFLMILLGPTDDWTALLPGLIVAGIGGAAMQTQMSAAAVDTAPRQRSGMATGISGTMRQVGSSLGIALLGAIFSGGYSHALPEALTGAGVPAPLASALVDGTAGNASFAGRVPPQVPTQFTASVQGATHAAFIQGFDDMLRVIVALVAIAVIGSLLFMRAKQFDGAPSAPPRAASPEAAPAPEVVRLPATK